MNVKIAVAGCFVVLAGLTLSGCSVSSEEPVSAGPGTAVLNTESLSKLQDSWLFKTKTKQNEVCEASNGGRSINDDVVDLYTLGQPSIYGSFEQVQAIIEFILIEECGNVTPLQDARKADAGAIAQATWARTINFSGISVVCEFWRGNNFDLGIMFGVGPSALESAGFSPEDGKILEFVASYDLIIRENCE